LAGVEFIDENGGGPRVLTTEAVIQKGLISRHKLAGVEFIEENGGGPSVRPRQSRKR
jgi:hypothetical protein